MKYTDVDQFKPNDEYYEEIHPDVWLMDNHQWAYYIWEKYCFEKGTVDPLILLHLDYHWDGINDFLKDSSQSRLRAISDINEILNLVKNTGYVTKDSFIAPAVIRKIIDEIHFLCFQDNTERGIDGPLLEKYGANQLFHEDIHSIKGLDLKPYIFDLDIDIFNESDFYGEGPIWEKEKIDRFIDDCGILVQNASLITIAMSFGYSGSPEDTITLTKEVVPKIIDLRKL